MLGTIIAHIDIEKLNERGKKVLNAKLERHLARPHTLSYEVSAFIYIYIYILILDQHLSLSVTTLIKLLNLQFPNSIS